MPRSFNCLLFNSISFLPMPQKFFILKLVLLMIVTSVQAQVLPVKRDAFQWDTLAPLPDPVGFAGPFAGVADDVLIVAGGSNFPNGGTPWNGGAKKWYDKIFV